MLTFHTTKSKPEFLNEIIRFSLRNVTSIRQKLNVMKKMKISNHVIHNIIRIKNFTVEISKASLQISFRNS